MTVAASAGNTDLLAARVRRSLGWSTLNNLVTRSGTLLIGIVLARVLVPADYGLFAVALVTLQLLLSLNDIGLSSAIIRWPGEVQDLIGTAWVLIVTSSVLIFTAAWFGAPAFAAALGAPRASNIVRAMSFALLIDGAVGIHTALLTRSFQQGRRAVADTVNLVIYAAVAVTFAEHGFGAWSMVWGRLAGNTVSAVLIVRSCEQQVRPGWRTEHARALLGFGLPLAGSGILVVVVANMDYVVVGKLLGPVPLGLYLLAFNLSSWPVNMFSFAVRRVALAGFAQLIGDRQQMAVAFSRALALLLAAALPVCVLLSVLAKPIVLVVYGNKWSGAVQSLQLLALLAVVRITVELAYDLLVATGRSRLVLGLQLLWLIPLVPALVVGARLFGIRGVALAQLVVALTVVAPAFLVALDRVGVETRRMIREAFRPALGGTLAAVVALTATAALPGLLGPLLVGALGALFVHAVVVWPLVSGLRRPGPALPSTVA